MYQCPLQWIGPRRSRAAAEDANPIEGTIRIHVRPVRRDLRQRTPRSLQEPPPLQHDPQQLQQQYLQEQLKQ